MKNVLPFALIGLMFSLVGCGSAAQDFAPVPISVEDLHAEIAGRTGKVVVVNFWATWCAPCVIEFPDFVQFGKEFEGKGVDVVFVSADFEPDLPLANEFLKKHDVPWTTYWKTGNENTFISAMHEDWSGALPTTFIYGKDGQLVTFWEGLTTFEQLERKVTEALNS